MKPCTACGRPPERGGLDGQLIQTHNIGCRAAAERRDERLSDLDSFLESSMAAQCAKDGCDSPRATSKGPRPAKYCDEHKTRKVKS